MPRRVLTKFLFLHIKGHEPGRIRVEKKISWAGLKENILSRAAQGSKKYSGPGRNYVDF